MRGRHSAAVHILFFLSGAAGLVYQVVWSRLLNEVFGVTGESPLAEGWMKVVATDHPVTAGLRSSLHVFGGYSVKRGPATPLAELESSNRVIRGSAVLENRFGKGLAVLLAPDLLFSIVHIQQGLPVLQDGKPPFDDSAPVNDGVLKAEDGLVLDWQRDRKPLPPDGGPVFLEPVSDELRDDFAGTDKAGGKAERRDG